MTALTFLESSPEMKRGFVASLRGFAKRKFGKKIVWGKKALQRHDRQII